MPKETVKIIDANPATDWRNKSVMALPTLPLRLSLPGGQTLPQPTVGPTAQDIRLQVIKQPEIPGNIAYYKRGALSGWGEPYNLSTTLDVARIQAAIRAAERGDTWQLFTIFRDMECGYTHFQSEFAKRKLSVVGQPHVILPYKKGDKDDEKACKVIEEMITHCDNWNDGLDQLLSATLWPVSVIEKMFAPVNKSDKADYEFPVRFRLRKLDPVSPTLFCYKIPYLASGFGNASAQGLSPQFIPLGQEFGTWNPDSWEPELRIYEVFENGYPNFSPASTYEPTRDRHIVFRATNLSKTIRDNFGGQMRSILFWWFLATQARDWFGRYMQRWGSPFLLGRVDAQQKDTLEFMQQALSLSVQLGGLVIDKNAEAEMLQAASLDGATGYKAFLDICNDEVSKVVVGQTLSSSARSTGLGSGVAKLHGEVRQDYRQSDMRKLSTCLVNQLFKHYLRINGFTGKVKMIIWGGKDETQAELLARTVKDFLDGGLQLSDDGIEVVSERVGFGLERAPEPPAPMGGMNPAGKPFKRGGRSRPKKAQVKAYSDEDVIAVLEEADDARQELEKSKHELAVLQQELMLTKTFSGIKGNGVRSVKLS